MEMRQEEWAAQLEHEEEAEEEEEGDDENGALDHVSTFVKTSRMSSVAPL